MPGVVPRHPRATLPGKCNSNFPKKNRGPERSTTLPEVTEQAPASPGPATGLSDSVSDAVSLLSPVPPQVKEPVRIKHPHSARHCPLCYFKFLRQFIQDEGFYPHSQRAEAPRAWSRSHNWEAMRASLNLCGLSGMGAGARGMPACSRISVPVFFEEKIRQRDEDCEADEVFIRSKVHVKHHAGELGQ